MLSHLALRSGRAPNPTLTVQGSFSLTFPREIKTPFLRGVLAHIVYEGEFLKTAFLLANSSLRI